MFYYLLIAFQAFCMFHVYKSRNDYYWYFLIFFVPLIGGVVYFILKVINKTNVNNTLNTINHIINPLKEIKDLEKKLAFKDTFQNKVNLADALAEKNDFNNAIVYYEKALSGKYKNHPLTLNKILKCYFQIKNYKKVLHYANKLNLAKSSNGSICLYAISLKNCGFISEAEIQFKKTDKKYSHHTERLELSKFLVRRNKKEDAKIVLNNIIIEIENMIKSNKKKHKHIYNESKKLISEI